MKTLTLKQVLKQAPQLHYALWDDLRLNPVMPDGRLRKKADWHRWRCNGGDIPWIFLGCFACLVDTNLNGKCSKCPCFWGNVKECMDDGSIYDKWIFARTPENRSKYALLVRDAWRKT